MAFDWGYFFSLFSIGAFWQACVTVIVISTLSWGIGLVVGFLLACAKLSAPRWVKIPVELYIWFFRSVPLMVLLVFVYNLPQLFPVTQPLLGVPFIAGLVSMTVTEAAYMAEIHRGGLLSVAKGQSEAGHALSFSFIGIQRLIVIPQAFRISLPTLINEYITIIKLSSILSVVSLPELLLTGQRLYAQNFLVMETLLAVAVYYVMVVTVFTWLFRALENRLDIQRKRPQTLSEAECQALRQSLPALTEEIKTPAVNGAPPALDLEDLGLGRYRLETIADRRNAVDQLLPRLKYLEPAKRLETVERCVEKAGASLPRTLMMSSEGLRQWRRAGMVVGGHTVHHPILARITDAQARREICDGKAQLEKILGEDVCLFAYPNGRPHEDYLPQHVHMVRDAGFSAAVSTVWGAGDSRQDIYQLPRFTPWDRTQTKFGLRLVRNLLRSP